MGRRLRHFPGPAAKEEISVHDNIDECVGEDPQDLKGLREFQPKEACEYRHYVVEDVKEGERPLPQKRDQSIQQLKVFGEIEEI